MKSLEEFFKNRVVFYAQGYTIEEKLNTIPELVYFSSNIFKPEEYSLDFAKEQIKPFIVYLFSFSEFKYGSSRKYWSRWGGIDTDFCDVGGIKYLFPTTAHITNLNHKDHYFLLYNKKIKFSNFLNYINKTFEHEKEEISYSMPLKPFVFVIVIKNKK